MSLADQVPAQEPESGEPPLKRPILSQSMHIHMGMPARGMQTSVYVHVATSGKA